LYAYGYSRYTGMKDFTRAFPQQMAIQLKQRADINYQELQSSPMNMGLNSVNDRELRGMAFDAAFEEVVRIQSLNVLNNAQGLMMQREDSPLAQMGLTVGAQQDLLTRAADMAMTRTSADMGISGDELNSVLKHQEADAGISPERAAEIRSYYDSASVFAEYDLIDLDGWEKGESGAGRRYVEWYRDNLPTAVRQLNENEHGSVATLFTQDALDRSREAITLWSLADETASPRNQQVALDRALQLGAPATVFPTLIDATTEIPNEMKRVLWFELVQPALQDAARQGLNNEGTMQYVMSVLDTGHPTNTIATQAAKKLLRAMPQVAGIVKSNQRAVMQRILEENTQLGQGGHRIYHVPEEIRPGYDAREGMRWMTPRAQE
jgi:hypothetical protein